jgi:hypothetical protein
VPPDTISQKEAAMIELNQEQRQALQDGRPVLIRENGHEYVLLRPDVYERLADGLYDDAPRTAEEMDLLREESVAILDRYKQDVRS